MNTHDPNEVFINSVGLRLKGKGTKVDANPLNIHCALLDSCICTKDSDCGPNQTCTTLPGYTYHVCKTKNEKPVCNEDSSSFPAISGVVRYLDKDVPQLAAAALKKCL